jgi:aspartate aminotransferase-like enzyme
MLRMAEPVMYHRSSEFRELMRRVNENLQYLFQTSGPVLTLSCSGTGGVEATFVSLFSPGEKVIAVNGGKFGARWVTMPRALGLQCVEILNAWGTAPQPEQVREALLSHPDAKAVYLTHCETSTGTAADVRSLAGIIRERSDALVCVDGISAAGALELRFDEWGIDACVTGSQKGLMIPPGLAFVALSERAAAAIDRSRMPRFYLDLRRALMSWKTADTPWTPAASLIAGADLSLQMIRAEGIEHVWERHRRLGEAFRTGVKALGLRLLSTSPSDSVTAVWLPEGIDGKAFNASLKSECGITIAGGQESLEGKIFRVAHLGHCDDLDVLACVGALERTLSGFSHPLTPGAALSAVQNSFLSSLKKSGVQP